MNEDYLWDKSGEPDPEIVQLEKRLESLRYKRPVKPLPLPARSRWSSYLHFSPALAAAAALLILLLAGGLWLGLRSSGSKDKKELAATNAVNEVKQSEQIVSGPRPPIGTQTPAVIKEQRVEKLTAKVSTGAVGTRGKSSRRYSATRQMTASVSGANVPANPRRGQLAREEGENAKAQLIMALHIASDKLNTVQKKIQVNPGT
jgi:hypothetical protein